MKEIKCASLMIGDWIADRNGFPMHVVSVGDTYCYADFKGSKGDVWEFDDKTNPCYGVEITEEVASKIDSPRLQNKHGGYYYYFLPDMSFKVDYVHELQQLMRFFGDKKEIKL